MASESLAAGPFPHIPELCAGITSARNEEFVVWRHSQAHAVTSVSHKHRLLLPRLNVPQGTVRRKGAHHKEMSQLPSIERPSSPQHPRHSTLTTWCPQSWSQCCCHPGTGNRRDNLEVIRRTGPWLRVTTGQGPGFPGPLHRKRGLTCVGREFPADLNIALTGFEAVDGTHVVQTPTRYKVP